MKVIILMLFSTTFVIGCKVQSEAYAIDDIDQTLLTDEPSNYNDFDRLKDSQQRDEDIWDCIKRRKQIWSVTFEFPGEPSDSFLLYPAPELQISSFSQHIAVRHVSVNAGVPSRPYSRISELMKKSQKTRRNAVQIIRQKPIALLKNYATNINVTVTPNTRLNCSQISVLKRNVKPTLYIRFTENKLCFIYYTGIGLFGNRFANTILEGICNYFHTVTYQELNAKVSAFKISRYLIESYNKLDSPNYIYAKYFVQKDRKTSSRTFKPYNNYTYIYDNIYSFDEKFIRIINYNVKRSGSFIAQFSTKFICFSFWFDLLKLHSFLSPGNVVANEDDVFVSFAHVLPYVYDNIGNYSEDWFVSLISIIKINSRDHLGADLWSAKGSHLPERSFRGEAKTRLYYTGTTVIQVNFRYTNRKGKKQMRIEAIETVITEYQESYHFYKNLGGYPNDWIADLVNNIKLYKSWSTIGLFLFARDVANFTRMESLYNGTTKVILYFYESTMLNFTEILVNVKYRTESQKIERRQNPFNSTHKLIKIFNMENNNLTSYPLKLAIDINVSLITKNESIGITKFCEENPTQNSTETTKTRVITVKQLHLDYENLQKHDEYWLKRLKSHIEKHKTLSTEPALKLIDKTDPVYTSKCYTGSKTLMVHYGVIVTGRRTITRTIKIQVKTDKQKYYYDNIGSYEDTWIKALESNVAVHGTYSIIGSLILKRDDTNVTYTLRGYTGTTLIIIQFSVSNENGITKIKPKNEVLTNKQDFYYYNAGSYDKEFINELEYKLRKYKTWSIIGQLKHKRVSPNLTYTQSGYIGTTKVAVNFRTLKRKGFNQIIAEQTVLILTPAWYYENLGGYNYKWLRMLQHNMEKLDNYSTVGYLLPERDPESTNSLRGYTGTTKVLLHFDLLLPEGYRRNSDKPGFFKAIDVSMISEGFTVVARQTIVKNSEEGDVIKLATFGVLFLLCGLLVCALLIKQPQPLPTIWEPVGYLKDIYFYPIKALPPLCADSEEIGVCGAGLKNGWMFDRCFMVTDFVYNVCRVQCCDTLYAVRSKIWDHVLVLRHESIVDLIIDMNEISNGRRKMAYLGTLQIPVIDCGYTASSWITCVIRSTMPCNENYRLVFRIKNKNKRVEEKLGTMRLLECPPYSEYTKQLATFRPNLVVEISLNYELTAVFFKIKSHVFEVVNSSRNYTKEGCGRRMLYLTVRRFTDELIAIGNIVYIGYNSGPRNRMVIPWQNLDLRLQ